MNALTSTALAGIWGSWPRTEHDNPSRKLIVWGGVTSKYPGLFLGDTYSSDDRLWLRDSPTAIPNLPKTLQSPRMLSPHLPFLSPLLLAGLASRSDGSSSLLQLPLQKLTGVFPNKIVVHLILTLLWLLGGPGPTSLLAQLPNVAFNS